MRLMDIAGGFDAFILDQFGVLHDGADLYAGVFETLGELSGKPVTLLTNSGKSAEANAIRLEKFGVGVQLYDQLISSGEVTRLAILDGSLGERFKPGAAVHIVGREGEDYGFGPLALRAAEAHCADYILILGSDAPRTSLDEYAARLKPAATAGVPAICANPDHNMLTPQGPQPAPGAIAKVYESLGGKVTYVGKPEPFIYARIAKRYAGIKPERIIAVGDSPDHDVAGAASMGFRTALVRTGLISGMSEEEIRQRCKTQPDFILDQL